MSAKKYLVTGGGGFIGAALIKALLKSNYAVVCLDDFSRGAPRRLESVLDQIEVVEGDVRNLDVVIQAAKKVDAIIHLAYVNGTEFFYEKPELVLDVAIRGMLNVIDACRHHGIKELILASSSEVYQTPQMIPSDESVPLVIPDIFNPRYSYGGGKIACELMAINYGRSDFSRVVIFRPHNVYGPDMGWEHVLPQFIVRAKELSVKTDRDTLDFTIQGSGKETRAFIHIDDFTDGLMRVIEQGEHLHIYHIGNPEEVSIADVARLVVKYFDKKANIIPGSLQPGSTPRRCPEISKLSKLGFSPKISLEQGIPSIAQWYAENSQNE